MKVKDPVCGMEIDTASAFTTREHMGQTFYFCSASCAEQFDADPHKYAMSGSATTGFNPSLPLVRIELPIVGLKKNRMVSSLDKALLAVSGVRTAIVNPASGITPKLSRSRY
jgi:YHS domain-containing protein